MKKNITYRSPKLSDLDQLLDFINTLSNEQTFIRKQGAQLTRKEEKEYLQKFIEDISNKKAVKIFAFDGSNLVGAADIKMDIGALSHVGIFGITVSEQYRNRGIGTELMKRAIEEAKRSIKGLEIITMGVFADNDRAMHLYKKFGLKKYGELPNGVIRKGKHSNHIYMYMDVS